MGLFPSQLVAIGLGKESSYGAGAAPVTLLPVKNPQPVDKVGGLVDASWQGSAAGSYGEIPGTLDSEFTLTGPVLLDGIGYALAGLTGDVVFTGGTPNQHVMSLLNTGQQQPPSYAVTLSDGVGQLQYAGSKFSGLTLSFAGDGLFSWQGSVVGLVGAAAANALPALPALLPIGGWAGVVQLGGVIEAQMISGSITLTRQVSAERNVTGVQAPWLQRSDVLNVTGQVTVAAASDAYRAQMLSRTATTLDVLYTQGSSSLRLHCSEAYLATVNRTYGKRWVELDINIDVTANTSDAGASGGQSPVKVTLKNTIGSGVYA